MGRVSELRAAEGHGIDIRRWYDVSYWAGVFGVSHEELRSAVRRVGQDPDAVRRQLNVCDANSAQR